MTSSEPGVQKKVLQLTFRQLGAVFDLWRVLIECQAVRAELRPLLEAGLDEGEGVAPELDDLVVEGVDLHLVVLDLVKVVDGDA